MSEALATAGITAFQSPKGRLQTFSIPVTSEKDWGFNPQRGGYKHKGQEFNYKQKKFQSPKGRLQTEAMCSL